MMKKSRVGKMENDNRDMTREEINTAIDTVRNEADNNNDWDALIIGRMMNYMEANMDDFLECYEEELSEEDVDGLDY